MQKMVKGKSVEFWLIVGYIVLQYIVQWMYQLSFNIGTEILGEFVKVYLIIIVGYYALFIAKNKKGYAIRKIDVLLIILSFFAVQATIGAIDVNIALNGQSGRHEGFFSVLFYYVVFYCASHLPNDKEKKIILFVMIAIFVFSCFIGYLAALGFFDYTTYPGKMSHDLFGNPLYISKWKSVASIPYGNPNFFGTMTSMAVAVGMGVFLFASGRKYIKFFGFLIYGCGVAGAFCSQTSSCIVGNIMAFLLIIFAEYILYRKGTDKKLIIKRFKEILFLILVYIGIMLWINMVTDGIVVSEMEANKQYLDEGITSDKAFTKRMLNWKAALRMLPDYWLIGAGLDNYVFVTDRAGINLGAVYDKAHNEYLQIMLTEGIFSCITYIVFLFFIFIKGLKYWKEYRDSNRWVYLTLFIMFFSYIAQAFFNIRVIYVSPLFWISSGMFYGEQSKERKIISNNESNNETIN